MYRTFWFLPALMWILGCNSGAGGGSSLPTPPVRTEFTAVGGASLSPADTLGAFRGMIGLMIPATAAAIRDTASPLPCSYGANPPTPICDAGANPWIAIVRVRDSEIRESKDPSVWASLPGGDTLSLVPLDRYFGFIRDPGR